MPRGCTTAFAFAGARFAAPARLACALVACVLLAALALAGCSGGASVTEDSPHADAAAATVTSGSDLTEASQFVDVAIPFSSPVFADGDASGCLAITLDGDALDSKTVEVQVSTQGDELHVRLVPTEEASGDDPLVYFACYQGDLQIAAAAEGGALPGVTGGDGSVAVLDMPVRLTIPSGMAIEQTAQGRDDTGHATTTVEVTQFAQLRCCTWFSVGDERFYMHHHTFSRESEITCAKAFADAVNSECAGSYSATSSGASVTITAATSDGAPFDVSIDEGVR